MIRSLIFFPVICLAVNITVAQEGYTSGETFMPGIVSTDSLEFGSAMSADGNTFYFSRSVEKRTKIFVIQKSAEEWSEPVPVAFSAEGYSDADPAISPDGDLYFISTRPVDNKDTTTDYDIWKVTSLPGRGWSEPNPVKELNSGGNEFYISFTRNGDAYFASSRDGGYGEEDIYFSEYKNKIFQSPINPGPTINSVHSEYDPFTTPDGCGLIFTSSGRADSFGKADLYWSVKTGGTWSTPGHFGRDINSPTRDFCPYITADLKYFFHSTQGDIKIRSTRQLPDSLISILHMAHEH